MSLLLRFIQKTNLAIFWGKPIAQIVWSKSFDIHYCATKFQRRGVNLYCRESFEHRELSRFYMEYGLLKDSDVHAIYSIGMKDEVILLSYELAS